MRNLIKWIITDIKMLFVSLYSIHYFVTQILEVKSVFQWRTTNLYEVWVTTATLQLSKAMLNVIANSYDS